MGPMINLNILPIMTVPYFRKICITYPEKPACFASGSD
jgi:hypothetical protein